jgi:phenylacetate-CoA ligase
MGYRIKRLHDTARGVRAAKELAERERWPRERLEAFQQQRLAELARHAVEHSSFWRARLPHGRIELSELPVLTKSELMERFDELVTEPRLRRDELLEHLARIRDDALYLGAYRVMTSSGSSGRKAVFVYDRAGWIAVLTMFLRRSDWVGLRPSVPRTRLAMIGGGAPTHMSRRGAQCLEVGIHRMLSLSVTQPVEELVSALNGFQPDFVNVLPVHRRPARGRAAGGSATAGPARAHHEQRAAQRSAAQVSRSRLRRDADRLLCHNRRRLGA